MKRFFSAILILAMVVTMLAGLSLTASAETYSGTCGESLTWTLDTETGVLEITGTGQMPNWKRIQVPWYSYRRTISSVSIGSGVTSIGDYAFYDCTRLTGITIPDSVTSIGDYAFYDCRGLTAVHITDIAAWCSIAFSNYSANPLVYAHNLYLSGELITDLVIPDSVTSIGASAFYDCTSLTSVTIPEGVTSIGKSAFRDCSGLTSVTIGDGVTSISDYAFDGCTGLTSVIIGNGVTSIGIGVFGNTGYYNNESNWTNGILYIGDYLINAKETLTGAYTVKAGTKLIADYAFSDCSGLTCVTIPDSVTSIADGAFSFCHSLTSVTLGNSVTSIGVGAFEECSLTSITIPESVMSIGSGAFYDCNLSSIRIPESVTSIGDYAFHQCSLTRITVAENNTVYDSRNNCEAIIDTASNTLIVGSANTVIPDSVTSIGKEAFCGLTGLTSIVIPDGVTSIGDNAFMCPNLATVTIPISVTSIGFAAFDTVLTDVYYLGTEADWNRISIGEYNGSLTGATIHYLAEGLKIDTASLTLYEDIAVNFTASVPEGLTDPYMVIEMNGQSYTLQASREDAQGRLVFVFMNLTPDQMGDNIKATLYATTEDGQLVHFCKPEYSVKQYCTNVMAAYPDNQKLQTLLSDMLVYGAATQQFTDHNTDSLVTEGVDLSAASTFTDLTSTDFTRTGTADDNIQWTGAGLECGSRMSMYFTLNTTAGEATSVEVTINGRTTIYSYSDMTVTDESDFGATCRVTFRGISACEYGDTVTAILKNNGEQVGQTLTYSVNSYVYSKQHDTAVENLAQLVQAIYNYGASARNYLS